MPARGRRSDCRSLGRTPARIPRIFSLGDHLLHDRVQILQPRRTAERLAAHIDVVGYRVVAEVDRIGEGVQPVRKVELVPRHFDDRRMRQRIEHARARETEGGLRAVEGVASANARLRR